MAKKGKYGIYIAGGIALLFGILAFCMMFLDAVTYTGKIAGSQVNLAGSLLAFGGEVEIKDFGSLAFPFKTLSFNIMVTLAFFLPLVGGVLALLFKNGLIAKIVTTACFVVGAVFMFSTTGFVSIGMEEGVASTITEEGYTVKLAVGPIIGGIFAILGAVVCFFKGTIAKKIGC